MRPCNYSKNSVDSACEGEKIDRDDPIFIFPLLNCSSPGDFLFINVDVSSHSRGMDQNMKAVF